MLCVWWDMKGKVYYEFLEPKQTLNANLYSEQLMRLNVKNIGKKNLTRSREEKTILLHDNARPHVAKVTQETIMELEWDVLPHAAYSPDLAPSDYYLFRSLEHYLRDKNFTNIQDLQNQLNFYFDSKPLTFYRDGIRQLPIK